jgi:hypothetical protein
MEILQGPDRPSITAVDDAQASMRVQKCSNCHTEDKEIEYVTHDGKILCIDCYGELVALCAHCGSPFWREDTTEVNGDRYCVACLDENFRQCASCSEYVNRNRARYSEIHDCDYCEACFSDRVTFCALCHEQIDPESCRINDDGDRFCEDCWEHRNDPEEGEYRELSGNRFVRCVSRRKYGIEIEAMLDEGEDHMSSCQLGVWNQVTDGSLGDSGREYVSPILQGDEGFEEIDKFAAVLKEWGYFVNRKCGLHVHIDGRDFNCADVKTLLKITRYFEPVLYAMLPSSRHEGTYSVPLERFPKSRLRIGAKDENALKKLWYGSKGETVDLKSKYHHSRYYGLNIHSWFYRRSFEFRYHSGTLSPYKITNFIVICQAFVEAAKTVKKFKLPQPVDFHNQLANFATFLNLSPEVASYIRQRIMKFHPDRLTGVVSTQA